MTRITSLRSLIKRLDETPPDQYNQVISCIDMPASEFTAFASWGTAAYTRNCIKRTETYELVLLCWQKGAKTSIHGHDGQRCWVYQVKGEVTECRYREDETGQLQESHRMRLLPGNLTYMHNSMGYHSLENSGDDRAITLHIYVAPIDVCEVYDEEKGAFAEVRLFYHKMFELSLP